MTKLLVTIAFLFSMGINASEIDGFTSRYLELEEGTKVLNAKANQLLSEVLEKANKKKKCDEARLYQLMKRYFKNHYVDKFSKWVMKTDDLPKRRIGFRDSIYQDLNIFDSFIIGGIGKVYDSAGPVVNVKGVVVGHDKFEHFFGRGKAYFERYYERGMTIEEVLQFGLDSEVGILGSLMTGVMSFGDLAANFKGLFFWNHILKRNKDVADIGLSHLGPYVKCEDKKWVKANPIDLSVYIDDAWDESVNCSQFRNQKITDKVIKRLQMLESEDELGRRYQCPVKPESLDSLADHYGDFGPWFLNTKGHIATPKK